MVLNQLARSGQMNIPAVLGTMAGSSETVANISNIQPSSGGKAVMSALISRLQQKVQPTKLYAKL